MNNIKPTPENIRRKAELIRGYRAKIKDNPFILNNIVGLGGDITDQDVAEAQKSKLSKEVLAVLLEGLGEAVDHAPQDSGEGVGQYY